jgi:circadian clock protein KaiC
MQPPSAARSAPTLPKASTGIAGLDDVTAGGLPRGRATLVCGGPGCGKTLLGLEFILRGASELGEPGAIITFEENAEELADNVRSLGFDLNDLVARRLVAVDYVHVDPNEIEETGEYDLDGLFVRMALAMDSVGARRVLLDTIEALFGGFLNMGVLRSELRRLFRWLKERGVTAVVTGERGSESLTRHGLQEYVSDCVISLDHRVRDEVSTRRLRVVKYRGSVHGTNEYPFLIRSSGISVLPLTSVGLDHPASPERISAGHEGLDGMLGGRGFLRGSSVIVSGPAGSGKSTVGAHFADGACRGGARASVFLFEESPQQYLRNMRSVSLDLEGHIREGLLRLQAGLATSQGLEQHLLDLHQAIDEFRPEVVVLDPITAFSRSSIRPEVDSMILRMVDSLKSRGITAMFCYSAC